ncbi:lipocalin-like domain-containing protein [Fischerella sp. PCC 9605]|uniref:lipocalin-like domain-containing protein n=1 Tax=Fischerella sp. PCC 9605 TaxID=1173024 RepID=UPI0004B9ED83|nr:lipocalin-like domain-containing protein [Fischerella sp. PCC 9605]
MSGQSFTQNNPLLGTWKLISAIAISPDGTVDAEAYGPNPSGYITYTPEGRMMVLFSRSDRLPFSADIRSPFTSNIHSVPLEERAQAFVSFNAYAVTYALSDNTVTHHVEIASIPNRVGTDLVRTFTLNGNRITLKTPPTMSGNVSKVFELMWERVEPISSIQTNTIL